MWEDTLRVGYTCSLEAGGREGERARERCTCGETGQEDHVRMSVEEREPSNDAGVARYAAHREDAATELEREEDDSDPLNK